MWPTSGYRYFLYRDTTDMRKGVDTLAGLVRGTLNRDPLDGAVYIFFNRRRTQIRLLVWDRNGFTLWARRLEKGTYELPAEESRSITWTELLLILEGIKLKSVERRKRYIHGQKCG